MALVTPRTMIAFTVLADPIQTPFNTSSPFHWMSDGGQDVVLFPRLLWDLLGEACALGHSHTVGVGESGHVLGNGSYNSLFTAKF